MDTTERKIKILIVDDDKTTRDTLSFLLTRKGFTTEKSENGKQALEKIGRGKPDLILLDAVMPVMDGFEACRELRENPKTQTIPIIFCSATHIEEGKKRKIEVDNYIQKPFPIDDLYKKIHKALKARGINTPTLEKKL